MQSPLVLESTCRSEKARTAVFALTCCALALIAVPFRPGVVVGESMAPTFHSGQVFLAAQIRDPAAIHHGDVVLVSVGSQTFVKRVYALGGERVWAIRSDGIGAAFDRVIDPSEVSTFQNLTRRHRGLGEVVELVVPDQTIFVLGDATFNSIDSRHFGPVSLDAVQGKVVVSRLFHLWRSNEALADRGCSDHQIALSTPH